MGPISSVVAPRVQSRIACAAAVAAAKTVDPKNPDAGEWWDGKYPVPAPRSHPGHPIPFQRARKFIRDPPPPSQYAAAAEGPSYHTQKPQNGEKIVQSGMTASALLVILGLIGKLTA